MDKPFALLINLTYNFFMFLAGVIALLSWCSEMTAGPCREKLHF